MPLGFGEIRIRAAMILLRMIRPWLQPGHAEPMRQPADQALVQRDRPMGD
jgi:hypothetical protein